MIDTPDLKPRRMYIGCVYMGCLRMRLRCVSHDRRKRSSRGNAIAHPHATLFQFDARASRHPAPRCHDREAMIGGGAKRRRVARRRCRTPATIRAILTLLPTRHVGLVEYPL